jgi:glycosyltransferase involved in cell wall biosynthesis
VVVISRLDEDKFSIPIFMGACEFLFAAYPQATVHCAGDGELSGALRLAIHSREWRDKARLLGFVNDPSSLYSEADVIFLPSKRESYPYVLLEATAAGRPVVVPHLGAARDAAVGPGVFSFRPGDPESAFQAIVEALQSSPSASITEPRAEVGDWAETVRAAYGL